MPGRDRQRLQAQISTTHLSSLDGSSLSPGWRQATLSTAGFVMLQLGASCLSPSTYSGLPFLSFSWPNKQKKKHHPWLTEALALLGMLLSRRVMLTLRGQHQQPSKGQHPPPNLSASRSPARTQSSIWSPSPSSPRQLARTEQNALWF